MAVDYTVAVDHRMDGIRMTAVNHTFPPELWEIICTELADQQDPRFHWKYSTEWIEEARSALYSLCATSKTLRCIAQPLLLRSRCTEEEPGGLLNFAENIMSKPRLASLVRCLKIAPGRSFYFKELEKYPDYRMLLEAANRLGIDTSLFSAWIGVSLFSKTKLSPLAQLLPHFLPKLKYLHIRLADYEAPCQILQTLRERSVITPFESVTTLLLESPKGMFGGWVLQRYSPLLALLTNLRLLSLRNCHGIYAAEDTTRHEWYDSGEIIVDWMPKRLQSIHMRACNLSTPAITALLSNCHSLENVFYAPEGGHVLDPYTTHAGYCQVVQALRGSKNTLRYLDLGIDISTYFSGLSGPLRNNDVITEDLAEMWQVLQEFPHVTHISANGKGYQKKGSGPFDWVCVKNTRDVRYRTLDFQFAMEQAMGF